MKFLMFDPVKSNNCNEFSEMVTERGLYLLRGTEYEPSLKPSEWLSHTMDLVQEADGFIGLSNFIVFAQLGDPGSKILELIKHKIQKGVPALFQLHRGLFINAPELVRSLGPILKEIGATPTEVRVKSDHLGWAEHLHPYICRFEKQDDCLRDARLFKGVQTVVASQANLISYDGEAVPIIDCCRLHDYIDSGDFRTKEIPGIRPAIAAARFTDSGAIQTIISGNLLNDSYETFAGKFPGISANRKFAGNLIDCLVAAKSDENRTISKAYELFVQIEQSLGTLAVEVIEAHNPGKSFAEFVPKHITEELRDSGGRIRFGSATFDNITDIILYNWKSFEGLFRDREDLLDREQVKAILKNINRGPRRLLAHPHRLKQEARDITETDISILSRALHIIQRAKTIYRE